MPALLNACQIFLLVTPTRKRTAESMTHPLPPLTFSQPRKGRLRKTAEFQKCYRGIKVGNDHLLIFASRNDNGDTRFGVSVSRKHGNAVARGRKKRLLREAFRLSQHDLPIGFDFVLVPRQTSDSHLQDFCRSLVRLAEKAARKFKGRT